MTLVLTLTGLIIAYTLRKQIRFYLEQNPNDDSDVNWMKGERK